jgi:hypothetical protein
MVAELDRRRMVASEDHHEGVASFAPERCEPKNQRTHHFVGPFERPAPVHAVRSLFSDGAIKSPPTRWCCITSPRKASLSCVLSARLGGNASRDIPLSSLLQGGT